MKADHVMKTRIILGLWVAVVASWVTVRAHDNPAQAAAREALEQKLRELDNPQIQPAPVTPSWTAGEPNGESATNAPHPIRAKAVTPVPAPPTAVAAPVNAASMSTPAPIKPPPVAAAERPKPTPVRAATQSSIPPVKLKPTNEIVTIYGTIYKNAQVEKVEADGIIISYWTAGGGMAMSKVYFEDLPYEVRQRFKKK